MSTTRPTSGLLRSVLIASLVAAGLLACVGSAHAATVQPFQFQDTFTDTVDDSATCLGPGATGTITGTVNVTGQFTDTYDFDPDPGGPRGFHVHGTEALSYRIVYDDGGYLIGNAVTHFDFDDNPNQLRTTDTEAVQDRATLYGSDGTTLGPVTVHATSHITFSDANGNGQPDPDEISASVDRFRLSCP